MKKWFHAIGVSGHTTSNLARFFKEKGWFVTGSDLQFFPPASNILKENKINTIDSYNYEHLTKDFWENELKKNLDIPSVPDLVMVVESVTAKNKEYLFAKNKGLDIRPYSQILSEYLIKDNSIVVAGTAGKTTTTALLIHALNNLGFDPSYMVGAQVNGFDHWLKDTGSKWSVIEGDEYHNIDISNGAKFLEYKPKYLVLTNVGWEHQDVFPTKEAYVDEFEKLVKLVPHNGLIVSHNNDKNIEKILLSAMCKVVKYAVIESETEIGKGYWSLIKGADKVCSIYADSGQFILSFKTDLIGNYVLEDMLAAVTLILNLPADVIPVDLMPKGTEYLKDIVEALQNFQGVSKRLEILKKSEDLVVLDDFAAVPTRAKKSLETIHSEFPEYKTVAIFEPNSGSRKKENFSEIYKDVFKNADEVIIPELSNTASDLMSQSDLVNNLEKIGVNASAVNSDQLIEYLDNKIKDKNNKFLIVFFSSYRLSKIARDFAGNRK